MRETPLSNCERDFVKKAVAEKLRVDGRQAYDYRTLRISFGVDRGCCQVQLGDTRVMSQVSCQVVEPKASRPADGMLYINVELSPMASPGFEAGRLSDFGVEINRLLERCLKESRCVDTESLCIVSGERAWEIRADIHVLNHDGNLVDACSIAAIAALAHFRRPDVTVSGDEITIHPIEEREPVPLSIHHMPICVTFAFFEQGKYLLVDPTDLEEKVMDGKMVIGMNKHREICTLQIGGQMLLLKDQLSRGESLGRSIVIPSDVGVVPIQKLQQATKWVLRCSNIAVVKVAEITELIHKALENDRQERAKGGKFGFAESVSRNKLTANQKTSEPIDMKDVENQMEGKITRVSGSESGMDSDVVSSDEDKVVIMDKGVGSIGMGGPSQWQVDEEMEELKTEANEVEGQSKMAANRKTKQTHMETDGNLGNSSEEEVTEVLGADLKLQQKIPPRSQKLQSNGKRKKKKGKT